MRTPEHPVGALESTMRSNRWIVWRRRREGTVKEIVTMETIERTRSNTPSNAGKPANEVERLRAQNAILLAAIASASAAMTSAPNWHEMHRSAHKVLQVALNHVDAAPKLEVPPRKLA
jgi:hypothetical protein